MAYTFNPEAFVSREPNYEEWSRQQTNSIQQAGEAFAQGQQRKEDRRRFDTEQARLADNEANRRLEHQGQMELHRAQFGLDVQQHGLQQKKFAAEQDAKDAAIEREGLAIIQKALSEAGTLEEYNAILTSASEEYGLDISPVQSRPQQSPGMAGMQPPPGMEADVEATVAAEQPRNQAEAQAVEQLPEGGEVTPEGKAVSKQITDGATQGAERMGVPTSLGTTEDAGPKVNEAPPAAPLSLEQVFDNFSKGSPIAKIDSDSRLKTDDDVKASFQARMSQIQAMPLTPEQKMMAVNLAAQAHGIPPMQMPPPPVANPQAPPEEQVPMEMEVTLPPEVANMVMAPPELPRDMVREGNEFGAFEIRSARTGAMLGVFDWNAVQDERRTKRYKEAMPIIDMVDDPRDKQLLQKAVESYIENGDEQGYKLVSAFVTNRNREESTRLAAASQDRLAGGEALKVVEAVNTEVRALQDKFEKVHKVNEAREKINMADSAIVKMAQTPLEERNAMGERSALSDLLAIAATRRATDKDFERFMGKSLAGDAQTLSNYIAGTGEISDVQLKQMSAILAKMKEYEEHRMQFYRQELRRAVGNSYKLQSLAPDQISTLVEQADREMFPGYGGTAPINHKVDPTFGHRREVRTRGSSSSSSTTTISADEDL